MAPDKYQQAWQEHGARTRVKVDAELLLLEVQRSQKNFQATILRRDFMEIGIAFVMIPVWFFLGYQFSLPWTWYLTVPALIWVGGFMLVYRWRNQRKPNNPDQPLFSSVENSLADVDDQIWLLRNIFWWYLLPPTISIFAFFTEVILASSEDWLDALWQCHLFVFVIVVYGFLYYLNQRAVRTQLEPRKQELLTLRASLQDESNVEFSGPRDSDDTLDVGALAESDPTIGKTEKIRKSKSKLGYILVGGCSLAALVAVVAFSELFVTPYDKLAQSDGPNGAALAELVTDLRAEKNLVGLAAMATVDGEITAVAAHGERKAGSGVAIELDDQWHLGGIAKSITATMIARLVESGKMSWSDTVGDYFGDTPIDEIWKQVTLRQLLTDSAGAPAQFSLGIRRKSPPFGPKCMQARREAVLKVMGSAPEYTPGEKHVYSNVGYTIAAALAEKATGNAWSELVQREVFEPLQLTGSGFGPPKSGKRTLEQPRGHRVRLGGKTSVRDTADNTSIMGPSAAVHMTLDDLCTFANEHLRGEQGNGRLLTTETYKLLHTPDLAQYGYGWIVSKPDGVVPHEAFWHNGSNTHWYALVVFVPEKNAVVAITSNDPDFRSAVSAAWEIVGSQFVDSPRDASIGTYPKKSPFHGVRWNQDEPQVRIDREWFKLVSLNDIPTSEILVFSKENYGDLWQKRFDEDLVELLSLMGHTPGHKVKLELQSLSSSKILVRDDVLMTEEKRRTIRNARSD